MRVCALQSTLWLCAAALLGCSGRSEAPEQPSAEHEGHTPAHEHEPGSATADPHAGHKMPTGHEGHAGDGVQGGDPHADHDHTGSVLPPTAPLPGLSLFQLNSTWTDQDGNELRLASLRGKPTAVVLFYGTCQSVCPILLTDVTRIDAALPAEARAKMQYLLVTIDPATDTVARLKEVARERSLDTTRFHLVRGTDDGVRELANTLGVQYRKVREGEYAHSAVINLLDRDGVFAHQTVGLGQPVEPMVERIAAALR